MRKLFTNDKFFLIVVILGCVGELLCCTLPIFIGGLQISWFVSVVARVLCLLLLYVSYRKHSKNVMKALMGAILMAEFIKTLAFLDAPDATHDLVCAIICSALLFLLFINHLLINDNHKASPLKVYTNQIICVLLAVCMLVWDIFWFIASDSVIGKIAMIFGMIGYSCTVASIVCVESRLDAYRLDRQDAGWTEEKGYPVGYVHQFEKDKKNK